jgi:two-component system sensor histidine kinase CpxA
MSPPFDNLYQRLTLYVGAALIAFILLGAASFALIASWELRGYSSAKDSPLATEAAATLASGGEAALRDWLATQERERDAIAIYVLDQDSRDLLGRELPAPLVGFVRNSVIARPASPDDNLLPVRLAPQLVGPDGRLLTLLILPRNISFWGSPATLAGLLLAALLVTGVVAWLIARAVSRPLRELQNAARELASGHTAARVPDAIARRNDELGALAVDFNRMAGQLDVLISGREQLMQELSHELRGPLARLQAALALSGERRQPDPVQRAQIESEIQRMDGVIGDLLRYSRLNSVGAGERRLLRLDRLLDEIVAAEQVEAQAAGCELGLECERDLTLVGDRELLRRGFENIVRNAIRYAPAGTRVDIQGYRDARMICTSVRDRGPGVDKNLLEKIFEPFTRAPGGSTQSGTGLGLAIARRVFELHDGRVHASLRVGGGLCVTAELPAAQLT